MTVIADHFDTKETKVGLKSKAIRGVAFTLASRSFRQVMRIGSSIVIMRILAPEDFGLIAMIAAVTSFMEQFLDLGLSQATVQREKVTHQQVSNLFWINVGLGILITLIIIGLAPAITWFYNEPRLFWLTIVSATGFILVGLTVQHQAIIQRQMRIEALSIIYAVSSLLGPAVAIVSALMGAGVWSLVYMPIVENLVCAAGMWVVCSWRPGLPNRKGGTWEILKFGSNLTGANIVSYFSKNVDRILIGKRWLAEALGLYDRAYSLMLLPVRQITGPIELVAIPTLSRLQDDPVRYRSYYVKAVSFIAFTTIPIVLFLIVMSREIIELVLGKKWEAASSIFTVLGICALIQPVINSASWLFVSSGHTKRMFKATLVWSVAAVISFVIGLPFGAIGVAAAYTVFNFLGAIPFIAYAAGPTSVRIGDVLKGTWVWFASGLTAAGFLYVLKLLWPDFCDGIQGLIFCFFEIGIVYLASACILTRSMMPLSDIIEILRHLKREKTQGINGLEVAANEN